MAKIFRVLCFQIPNNNLLKTNENRVILFVAGRGI